MKKPDPYTVLGVPKDADTQTIRRAHRQRAKRAHRDTGGTDDQMRQVNEAWMILRDPARRQKYDETGDTDGQDQTVSDLISMFISACETLDTQPADPVQMVMKKLIQQIAQARRDQAYLKKKASLHRLTAAKVKAKGVNLLKIALENHAAEMERKCEAVKDEIDRWTRMIELLQDYRFDQPPPVKATFDDIASLHALFYQIFPA